MLVAAQGSGAAVGNIVCPHNVVAGAATVGLAGREGEVLRRTVGPCALYLAAEPGTPMPTAAVHMMAQLPAKNRFFTSDWLS